MNNNENNQEVYKCPDCGSQLEKEIACGAETYYCNVCKSLKSRKRIKGHPNYESGN